MKVLLNVGESLTAVMSGAAATTNPTYLATWKNSGGINQPAGSLSGATAVTLVAAPVEGQREVDYVSIYNADTAAVTVTLAKVVSGTSYSLAKMTLQAGDTLQVGSEIRVVDTSGQVKQTATSTTTAAIAVLPTQWRVFDAVASNLPDTAANDDLGLVLGTDGTDFASLQSIDFKAATTTAYARCFVVLPENYVAGSAITIRVRGGMLTTVADTTATVDLNVYSNAGDATGSADLCETAAQSINSLTFANKDFTVTPTDLVAGDLLNIKLAIDGEDGATVTAVVAAVAQVELRCSVSQ